MIKFYLQKTDKDQVVLEAARDLEEAFPGLKYLECKGLQSQGKPKNVYTESYADSDGLRTYHPSDTGKEVCHEETTIELTLLFIGDDKRKVYKKFQEYIEAGRFFWWDTARHLKAWLILVESTEPDEDVVKNGYIKTTFKFANIWGRTWNCDDNGKLV